MRNLITYLIIGLLLVLPSKANAEELTIHPDSPFIEYKSPELFTFKEILEISKNPENTKYKDRLSKLWCSPIISNQAYFRGASALKPFNERLNSRVLRCVSWNIEKSKRMREAIITFSSEKGFKALIDNKKAPADSKKRKEITRQRELLQSADLIILQEMEIGMKRSGYMNAARELAEAMNMNYVYAPQYLEIDPVRLGTENIYTNEGIIDTEATAHYKVDPDKYKGLFGGAVLSRYPIKNVILHPLKNQGYDWYEDEKQFTSFLEETRRNGSKFIFKNKLTREIKTGGRSFFRVDLHVPELPQQTLTVINIHLEIKCLPKAREKQIKEILSYIKDIRHPVIMAGDFNAAYTDMSPTNLKRATVRTVKDPYHWFSFALNYLTPYALTINIFRGTSNFTKNLDNPLAINIPVIAPNKLKPMFKTIRDFRFSDRTYFDFRGDKKRSIQDSGVLSNSNQKDLKGFKTSFKVNRPIFVIGKLRLDWMFIKSFWKKDKDSSLKYMFSPHFGETLTEMNRALLHPISDHDPNAVDLPFNEPILD